MSNPIHPALDSWATTLEAAIANTLASSTLMVEHLNSELKKRYDSSFESWKTAVLAGKIDNANPPQPPAGLVHSCRTPTRRRRRRHRHRSQVANR